jgi:hypothetical protein
MRCSNLSPLHSHRRLLNLQLFGPHIFKKKKKKTESRRRLGKINRELDRQVKISSIIQM